MAGYFDDTSAIRRIGRESVLMLGGPRALLLQAAHPLVAAGIVDHSEYRVAPWRRLARTMAALYTIVFDTRERADRMGTLTRRAHLGVRGERDGQPYSADDPELMLWVHSTLVDTALAMYETYVGRVSAAVADEFYAQMQVVGTVFGLPPAAHPPTLSDFRTYQRRMLETDVQVGADALAVARTVLSPPVPAVLRPALRAVALQSVGTLPPELRAEYGIRWRATERAAFLAGARSLRSLVPLVPPPLRRTERLPLRLLTAAAGLR
jgi:uncharacterized protein (DUF2236 family)